MIQPCQNIVQNPIGLFEQEKEAGRMLAIENTAAFIYGIRHLNLIKPLLHGERVGTQ